MSECWFQKKEDSMLGIKTQQMPRVPRFSSCHWHPLSLFRVGCVQSHAGPLGTTLLIVLVTRQCNFPFSAFWAHGMIELSGPLWLIEPCDQVGQSVVSGREVGHSLAGCLTRRFLFTLMVSGNVPYDWDCDSPQPHCDEQVIWVKLNLCCVIPLRFRGCLSPQHKLAYPDRYNAAKLELSIFCSIQIWAIPSPLMMVLPFY